MEMADIGSDDIEVYIDSEVDIETIMTWTILKVMYDTKTWYNLFYFNQIKLAVDCLADLPWVRLKKQE